MHEHLAVVCITVFVCLLFASSSCAASSAESVCDAVSGMCSLRAPAYLSASYASAQELFDAYEAYHRAVLADGELLARVPLVVFRVPGQGWANRLRTFASTYLFAVLSGRVFLVDWNHPVPLERLIETVFPWSASLAGLTHVDLHRAHTYTCKGPYEGSGGKASSWLMLEQQPLWSVLPEHRIFGVSGYSAFTTAFHANPHAKPLMRLFDAECPLRDIFPYLVRPAPAVAAAMQPLLARMRSADVVALQMRLGSATNYFEAGPVKSYLTDDLLAKYKSDTAYELWFDCAFKAVRADPALLVFLATDNPAAVTRAKELFGANLLYYEAPIEHSGGIEKVKTDDGQTKAMVDWFLLGEASVLYRTYWSTYGYTASLRTGVTTVTIPLEYSPTCALPTKFLPGEFTNHC
jgi:hypothetical protein